MIHPSDEDLSPGAPVALGWYDVRLWRWFVLRTNLSSTSQRRDQGHPQSMEGFVPRDGGGRSGDRPGFQPSDLFGSWNPGRCPGLVLRAPLALGSPTHAAKGASWMGHYRFGWVRRFMGGPPACARIWPSSQKGDVEHQANCSLVFWRVQLSQYSSGLNEHILTDD
jgi:hypothetical protein